MRRHVGVSLVLAAVAWAVIGLAWSDVAVAQPQIGAACNPNVRTGNPACARDANCRRLGDCGALNFLCVDNPATGRATKALSGSFPCTLCSGTRGQCETRGGCNSDAGCGTGGRCVQGFCTNVCQAGAQCLAGEACRDGVCQRVSRDRCNFDRDCSPGDLCRGGSCTTPCTNDTACASGEVCRQGFCGPPPSPPPPSSSPPPPSGPPCTIEGSKAECGPNGICRNQRCQPLGPECQSNAQCRPGEGCFDGRCLAM